MAGSDTSEPLEAPQRCSIGIVASSFNDYVVDRLLQGCTRTLSRAGIEQDQITLLRVPGAFEIPVAAAALARSGSVEAIVCLGAVIRGETAHFDYIAAECARGIARVALDTLVPVIFGVLTVDDVQQAIERCGDDDGNKGCEAAAAAVRMVAMMRTLQE